MQAAFHFRPSPPSKVITSSISASRPPKLQIRAEPAFSKLRVALRLCVVSLSRHVEDAFACYDANITLDRTRLPGAARSIG